MAEPRVFSSDEYASRLAKVRRNMEERELDVLLVTGPENICYLTGYATTGYHVYQALILPCTGEPCFVVRRLEVGNVRAHSWIKGAVGVADGADPIARTLQCLRATLQRDGRVGYEDQALFLSPAAADRLRANGKEMRFVPASGVVEAARVLKSPAEIACIREATRLAEAGLQAGLEACAPGLTENDVAAAVYAALARGGSEYTASPPFIAAGAHSAVGHATYAMGAITEKDNVWFEIGASRNRYHGGIGRTAALGTPSPKVTDLASLSHEVVEAMIAAIRPGATSGEVDAAGRSLVTKAGYGECWPHRGGYSLGISFPPGLGEGHIMDIKPGDERPLQAGMVFHLVPILFVPDVGAVGCTETVVVTESGRETYASLPRDLIRI